MSRAPSTSLDPAICHHSLEVIYVAAAAIAEHLGLAIRRARYVEHLVHRSMIFESALDRISDRHHFEIRPAPSSFHNRNAEQLLEPGLNTLQDNDRTVRDAVTVACEAIRSDGKRVVMQDVDTHDGSYIARTVRLPGGADAVLTLFHARATPERNLPVWDALTKREQQMAQLASEGLTTRQIAQRAFISENTVKQHLKRIYAKTDVNNRAELVQLIWSSTQSKDPSPSATR